MVAQATVVAMAAMVHRMAQPLVVLAALVAGFGRVIAEVGCSMMVGGNILHYTRNIPTAIALETSKGNLELAMALGIILLTISFSVTCLMMLIRHHQSDQKLKLA